MRIAATTAALWMFLTCIGCTSYKDITQLPEVQKTGLVGRCFVSKKELVIVENRWLKMKEIATAEEANYIGNIVDKFEIGTRVRIVRVERHYDGAAWWMLFALVEERKMPMAQVQNGSFAGKRMATSKGGISIDGGVDEHYWAACGPDIPTASK